MTYNICVYLTQNCNLKCSYCFVKKEKGVISDQSLFDSIDFAVKICKTQKEKVNYYFFGGEPLLHFDKIKLALDYMICNHRSILESNMFRIFIFTNGLLLNKERYHYILEKSKLMNNKLGLGISIDGTEKSNDHNRGYGSNLISKIRFISKKHSPSLDIGLICTIHPNELKNFFNNFKFFFDDLDVYSFVSGIAFHLANCDGWKAKHIKILKNEVKKIMGYYFKNKNRFKNIEITPISQITHGVKTYLSEQCFHLLTTNCNFKKLVVFPDGEINSCFIPRFMKDIKNNNSSLGNVSNFDTNIFLKKIKFLRTQFRIKDFIFDNYGKKSNNFLENLNKKYYSMSNKFCISFYGIENIELKTILEKTYFDTIKEESYRYEQNKQKWSLFKTL